jgi:hypothetical protein
MVVLPRKPVSRPRKGAARTAAPFRRALSGAFLLCLGGLSFSLLSTCSFILGLEPLKVTDWRPRGTQVAAASVGDIWVEFSQDINRTKAEQAFSFTENASPVPGSFGWTGNRLSFVPSRLVSAGNDYEISVLASAESTQGNSLSKDFRFAFTTKSEPGRPTIISFQPLDGSRISNTLLPVIIRFSEPIDPASFIAALSVSPDPGGVISFDATGSIATFTPLAEWKPGSTYSITVSDTVKDLSGNRLAAELKFQFISGSGSVRPTLVAARPTVNGVPQGSGLTLQDPAVGAPQVNAGFECTWGIGLQFSQPVLRENIESYIDFQPAWGYAIAPAGGPSDRFLLVPRDRFLWGALYSMTVRHGVVDVSGNASVADSGCFLRADGPRTRPPSVEHVRFRLNPADPPASATYANYEVTDVFANLDLTAFPIGGSAVVSHFDFYLRLADQAVVDPFSFMRTFSVTTTNGAAIITPVAVSVSSFADPQPPAIAGLTPVRVSVSVTNTSNSGVITLGLSESFTDTAGNALGRAFSLPLLK